MKLLFLFSFAFVSAFGAPVGNPSFPKIIHQGFFIPKKCWANVRGGYEGDFVVDGQMKQDEEGSGSVDKYTQTSNSGTATLNLLERLDLYGVFGTTMVCAQWRFSDMAERIRNVQMETHHDFLWAVGARAVLYSYGNWDLGLGARYSALHNHVLWLTVDGSNISVHGSRYRWREWQANLGVSYHIDLFTPYIGVDYLSARSILYRVNSSIADFGSKRDHFTNEIPVGMYLGCTLSMGKYFMLNVEARLIDEEAFSLNGDFRF